MILYVTLHLETHIYSLHTVLWQITYVLTVKRDVVTSRGLPRVSSCEEVAGLMQTELMLSYLKKNFFNEIDNPWYFCFYPSAKQGVLLS